MYKFFAEYKTALKYSSIAFFGCSAGWIYYQIKKTQDILNNALDTSVIQAVSSTTLKEENVTEGSLEFEPFLEYKKPGLLISILDKIKYSYARKLLALAQSEHKIYRLRAVKQLSQVTNLDDWHCALLRNMMDAKTAVGLARSQNVDKRLFKEPPYRFHNYNKIMLVNAMREFLITLYEKSQHPCLAYFLSKVFVHDQDSEHIVDHDSSSMELKKFLQSETEILPLCLESLVHHTSVEKYSNDIVEHKGLPLLMEVYRRFKDDINITVKLCHILSFLCVNQCSLESIYQSGWIGVLAEWVEHEDVRISVPAARALANLDINNEHKYSRNLYLLHPIYRCNKEPDVDVVFIHGLLGGVFFTWRQRNKNSSAVGLVDQPIRTTKGFIESIKEQLEIEDFFKDCEVVLEDIPVKSNDKDCPESYTCPGTVFADKAPKCLSKCYTTCWPKDWLGEDLKNSVRIIGINYNTSLSMWAPLCPSEKEKLTLEDRSDLMMEKLLKSGLGKRPIVWVTHSMGGLIVKNMLIKAIESKNSNIRDICWNTKGIVFYSTPHNGSKMANLSQATALVLWPSVEVQELRENSPKLKEIHEKFLEIAKMLPIKIVTFVETKSTVVTAMKFNILLVEPNSGNPGVGEYYEVPQDHLGICKPVNKFSFLYQKILSLLKDVMSETREENCKPFW